MESTDKYWIPVYNVLEKDCTIVLAHSKYESARKKKPVRVSKAGCYIKPLLAQCANSVVKSEKQPEINTTICA